MSPSDDTLASSTFIQALLGTSRPLQFRAEFSEHRKDLGRRKAPQTVRVAERTFAAKAGAAAKLPLQRHGAGALAAA